MSDNNDSTAPRVPRLWPAVLIVLLQLAALVLTVTPAINNATRFGIMMAGPAICVLLFSGWLLFFSRLRWRDRFIFWSGMILSGLVAGQMIHASMGVTLWIYGLPLVMLMIAATVWLSRDWSTTSRSLLVVTAIVCSWSPFLIARMDGFDGSYWPELSWRWVARQELAATSTSNRGAGDGDQLAGEVTATDWPGFRGAARNSQVSQATIPTDWKSTPLRELWRIPVGPAWSSFAAVGDVLFTQEQRGGSEVVVCYDASSGRELWRHADVSRFNEVVSGAGPRATPTFAAGRLFTLGGRGMLNCLAAGSGELLWQHDLMAELDAPLPMWGFSSSPIVVDQMVIVYTGAGDGRGLIAYHTETGEPVWEVDIQGMNYSSPQLASIDDQDLILWAGTSRIQAIIPATGQLAWEFEHQGQRSMSIVQPQQIGANRVIVPFGDGGGLAGLDVAFQDGDWQVTERWTTRHLKPSFNDFVYFDGHLYGFDQHIFTCIDAETGLRKWKQGRYGFGQVVLFRQQGLLLVTAEKGELVLLEANPGGHVELARAPAIAGKTWNHPTVTQNRLVVRNSEEAVCFELEASDG